MADMQRRMDEFMERTTNVLDTIAKPKNTIEVDEGEYATVGTIKALLHQQEEAKLNREIEIERKNIAYGRAYEAELLNIADEADDEELHMQVMKLVTEDGSKYNVKSSNDPSAAAQINYNKALRAVKSGNTGKKINLKGDKNLPPSGSKTKTGIKVEKEIDFGQDALDYMARVGMSVEEAKKLIKA